MILEVNQVSINVTNNNQKKNLLFARLWAIFCRTLLVYSRDECTPLALDLPVTFALTTSILFVEVYLCFMSGVGLGGGDSLTVL